jgi:hypothetical protein
MHISKKQWIARAGAAGVFVGAFAMLESDKIIAHPAYYACKLKHCVSNDCVATGVDNGARNGATPTVNADKGPPLPAFAATDMPPEKKAARAKGIDDKIDRMKRWATFA